MAHFLFDWLRAALVHYGYWAVAGMLLLENAGLPVPGETTLLLASFLAFSEHDLNLAWLIVIGTAAATLGDNVGYAIGRHWGRPVIERYRGVFRLSDNALSRGERLFARYGPATILFARFLFGMRVIAGPMAGVLRMPWKRFSLFNAIGAALWVSIIALVGYYSGRHWDRIIAFMRRFDLALASLAVAVILFLWRRNRKLERGTHRPDEST